ARRTWKKSWSTSHNKKSITAWSAFKRNSGSCWTRTESPTMSGTCGIEEDYSAPDLAPKGRNNEAQANGLGLDHPQILSSALKGRNRSSTIPELPTTTG